MRVGIGVDCTVCKRMKKPHGRSAPLCGCYCDSDCPGYELDPKPGCLWPRETEYDFPFACCDNASREVAQ